MRTPWGGDLYAGEEICQWNLAKASDQSSGRGKVCIPQSEILRLHHEASFFWKQLLQTRHLCQAMVRSNRTCLKKGQVVVKPKDLSQHFTKPFGRTGRVGHAHCLGQLDGFVAVKLKPASSVRTHEISMVDDCESSSEGVRTHQNHMSSPHEQGPRIRLRSHSASFPAKRHGRDESACVVDRIREPSPWQTRLTKEVSLRSMYCLSCAMLVRHLKAVAGGVGRTRCSRRIESHRQAREGDLRQGSRNGI